MKEYKISNLRNIGIIGHSSSGKTALSEAILYYTNTIDRLGKGEDGTTISDYDIEEKKRKISISTSILPVEWKEKKINIVDVPGYFDFVGEQIQGIRATDVATIVVCGVSGVQVGTEKAWDYCKEINLPKTFFINKLDRENSDYDKTLNQLKEKFGISVVPIEYPIGKEEEFNGVIDVISKTARAFNRKTNKMDIVDLPKELEGKVDECKQMIMEAVAETDEELLEKYFESGELSNEEIYTGLIKGCSTGDITPVMCGSSTSIIGIESFLNNIVKCFPSPEYSMPIKAKCKKDSADKFIKINSDDPFSAIIFKTIADPFVGKLSLFRVITGEINSDTMVFNSSENKGEKIGNLYFLRGKNQTTTKKIIAGDIGAVAKLQYSKTGDTICCQEFNVVYEELKFPNPVMSMSVIPMSKGDEDKISSSLNRLIDEDPTFRVSRDLENAETIIWGIGETHLDVIASKIKNKFGAEVKLREPKVPYREAIRGIADVQGKHKKQSGGHGQYGDVWIKFEPRTDDKDELEFVDKVVGGVVPRNFIPAVEKGLKECISKGVLAGYPVIKLKATLHDGSYHSVDSSEMAFKIAASMAYKKGLEKATPVLLEPIMALEVFIPDEYMGDIIGDINKKRGRVIGMEPIEKIQKVSAEVPMAEMFKYATDLRSMTQGKGEFALSFIRYEEVPPVEAQKVIEKNLKNES